MILKIDQGVYNVDLTPYSSYMAWTNTTYFQGENHYKILAYLANQLPDESEVADLGTNTGGSALALASNPKIKVRTYDINNRIPENVPTIRDISNIEFIVGDCTKLVDSYINSKIILLDIDPHDGIQEQRLIEELVRKNFQGIMLCDDIHHSQLIPFWNGITLKKADVTNYGHFSGTGVVVFNSNVIDVEIS